MLTYITYISSLFFSHDNFKQSKMNVRKRAFHTFLQQSLIISQVWTLGQKHGTYYGRCNGMTNLWANGDSYVLRPASRYSRAGRPRSHKYICPQRSVYERGKATARLHLATTPTHSLGGSRHSTGALFALAHSTTDWYHASHDKSMSPSSADTMTSTGLVGRPASNQKKK